MDIDRSIYLFFNGQISLEEYAQLKRWFNKSEENKKYFRETILILKATALDHGNKNYDTELALQNIQAKYFTTQKSGQINNFPLLAACIAFLLIAGSSLITYFLMKFPTENPSSYYVEVPAESKSKIIFPDGSSVWLNAGSKMEYNSGFGVLTREVKLDGEGFFDIRTDKTMPFRVLLPECTVEVLGTRFNLKSYHTDEHMRLALEEGSVRISDPQEIRVPVYLSPLQQYRYDKVHQTYMVEHIDANNIGSWKNGKIFFDNQPLADILNQLERIYNRKIELRTEALKNKRFYSDFDEHQPIEKVLDILSVGNKFKYHNETDTIHIY